MKSYIEFKFKTPATVRHQYALLSLARLALGSSSNAQKIGTSPLYDMQTLGKRVRVYFGEDSEVVTDFLDKMDSLLLQVLEKREETGKIPKMDPIANLIFLLENIEGEEAVKYYVPKV